MKSRPDHRPTLAAALATIALAGGAAAAQPPQREAGEARVRPPVQVDCPRDHLTLYGGKVTRYRRGPGRTVIRIRTDWDTTETIAIVHPGSDDPARWFLLEGGPFDASAWPQIEQSKGRLRTGMRAAAWICDDGRNPVVDWRPQRER